VLTTLLRRACSKRYAPQEHAPYNTRRATRSTSAVPNGSTATAERTERTPKRRSSCSIAAPVSSLCALEYCASYSAGRICTRDGPSFAALRQGWRKSNPNDGHSTPTAGLATIARKWNGLRARRLRRRYVLRARTWGFAHHTPIDRDASARGIVRLGKVQELVPVELHYLTIPDLPARCVLSRAAADRRRRRRRRRRRCLRAAPRPDDAS
jgi:hypothetical protein